MNRKIKMIVETIGKKNGKMFFLPDELKAAEQQYPDYFFLNAYYNSFMYNNSKKCYVMIKKRG